MENWQNDIMHLLFDACADESSTRKAVDIVLENMPNHLYKYRNPSENSIAALEHDFIFSSRLDTMNDIFEAPIFIPENALVQCLNDFYQTMLGRFPKPLPKTIQELSVKLQDFFLCDIPDISDSVIPKEKVSRLIQNQIERIYNGLRINLQSQYNVFCLSEVNDCELMWAHYANEHKGFCIEYDVRATNKRTLFLRESTLPINYTDEKYVTIDQLNLTNEKTGRFCMEASIIKSTAWSYEREWRTFFKSKEEHQKEDFFPVTAVYLGARISNEIETRLLSICKTKGIPVYKMFPDVKTHKLIPAMINKYCLHQI